MCNGNPKAGQGLNPGQFQQMGNGGFVPQAPQGGAIKVPLSSAQLNPNLVSQYGTGGAEPMAPSGPSTPAIGGVKSPMGPNGPAGFMPATPTPQGQWGATVGANPWVKALGPNHGQFPQGPAARKGFGGPGSGPTEGYTSPSAGLSGQGRMDAAAAYRQQSQDPAYRAQLVAAGKIAPGNWNEMQVMLNGLSPADKANYIAQYKAQFGVDPTTPPVQGTSGNPFGI